MSKRDSIDRSQITKCERPAIQEAWCGFFGAPLLFDKRAEEDFGAQVQGVVRKSTPIEPIPALVFQPAAPLETPPFWTRQFSWDSRKRIARIGRRYLTVHRLCSPPKDNYESYETEILPGANSWIDAIRSVVTEQDDLLIRSVTFGYINRFHFNVEGFALDHFFNLKVGFQAAAKPGEASVTDLNTKLRFSLPAKRHMVEMGLAVALLNPNKKQLTVTVSVLCRRDSATAGCLLDSQSIWNEVLEARNEAKIQFFSFCTDKTLKEIMGAK